MVKARHLPLAAVLALPIAVAAAQGCVSSNSGSATSTPAVSDVPNFVEIAGTKAPRPKPKEHPVVLVVLDGVRYQEVFGGADRQLGAQRGMDVSKLVGPEKLMPNLHRAIHERGIALGAPGRGEPVVASGPDFISLPGYIEILTGRPAADCTSNYCGRIKSKTLVDEVRAVSHSTGEVAVFASWAPLQQAVSPEPQRVVLSTGNQIVFGTGEITSDRKLAQTFFLGNDALPYPSDDDDYRPDFWTSRIALRYLAAKQPRFLTVVLGDPDEYGHKNDYYDYLNALKESDKFIGELFSTLDQMGERGRSTVVFVTADHGREKDFRGHGGEWPESSRVWLVAAGGETPLKGVSAAKKQRRLADIAPTIRALMALPPDTSPTAGEPITEVLPEDMDLPPRIAEAASSPAAEKSPVAEK